MSFNSYPISLIPESVFTPSWFFFLIVNNVRIIFLYCFLLLLLTNNVCTFLINNKQTVLKKKKIALLPTASRIAGWIPGFNKIFSNKKYGSHRYGMDSHPNQEVSVIRGVPIICTSKAETEPLHRQEKAPKGCVSSIRRLIPRILR